MSDVDFTSYNILRTMVEGLVDEYTDNVLAYRKVRDAQSTEDRTINRERKVVRNLADLSLTDDDEDRLSDLLSSIADTIETEMAEADMPSRFGAHVLAALHGQVTEMIVSAVMADLPDDSPVSSDVWSHETFASKRATIDSLFAALGSSWPDRNLPVDYGRIPVKVAEKTGNVLLNIPKSPKAESDTTAVKVDNAVTKRVELWRDGVCISYKANGEFQTSRYALQLIDAYLTPKVINDQLKLQGKTMAHNEWTCEIPAKFGGGYLQGKAVKV